MTPSSFPRSGASRISRAIQRTRTAPLSTERRPTDSPCPRTFRSRCTGRPPPTTAPPTPHPRHGLGQPILEHTRSWDRRRRISDSVLRRRTARRTREQLGPHTKGRSIRSPLPLLRARESFLRQDVETGFRRTGAL